MAVRPKATQQVGGPGNGGRQPLESAPESVQFGRGLRYVRAGGPTNVQDAWLRLERGRNGLSAGDVRVTLFAGAFPSDVTPAVASHQLSLTDFDAGGITRDVILQFIRDPAPNLPTGVDAQAVGEHLYTRALAGPVLAAFEALERAPEGVRVWLDILEPPPVAGDAPSLAELPWEALAKPDVTGGQFPDFLALRETWTIVRALKNAAVQPTTDRSLRILVLTGDDVLEARTPPSASIRADDDAALVQRPFQASDWSAHVEVELQPPAPRLRAVVGAVQPHVLHYIGHGGVSPASNRHALVFRTGPAAVWTWDVNDVPRDLKAQKAVPRLAVINACYEAGALEQSTSLARAFLSAGAAGAVGMQARVRADYALLFSRGFYTAIAAGDAPDVALRKGRTAIIEGDTAPGANQLDRDWILPSLTLALPPDQVLPRAEYVDMVKRCGVRRDMREQGPFVDRQEQRRGVLTTLARRNSSGSPHGVLVRGLDQAGKSWFVKRCLPELAQAGAIVRYCDLTGGQGDASSREVVARLRGGWTTTLQSFAYDPLPDPEFAEYDAVRAELQPILEASGDMGLSAPQIARLFETFRKGLEALAQTRRVVIVLDQFSRLQRAFPVAEFSTYLYPHLIQPILQHKVGDVCIVLALGEHELGVYGWKKETGDAIPPGLETFEVPLFREADARRLFLEFCGFEWHEGESKLFDLLKLVISNKGQWKPQELSIIRPLMARVREEQKRQP